MFVPIFIAHVAALLALAWAKPPPLPTPTRGSSVLMVFDVTPERHVEQPRPAVVPPVAALEPAPLPILAAWVNPPIALPAVTAPQVVVRQIMAGEECDLSDIVQQALRDDDVADAALTGLPQSARSVANAVMIWNGGWIDGATPLARQALAEVRRVVRGTIETASANCRLQDQTGPRLMRLPGSPDIILALGSGRWRWQDMLSDGGDGRDPRAIVTAGATTNGSTANPLTPPAGL